MRSASAIQLFRKQNTPKTNQDRCKQKKQQYGSESKGQGFFLLLFSPKEIERTNSEMLTGKLKLLRFNTEKVAGTHSQTIRRRLLTSKKGRFSGKTISVPVTEVDNDTSGFKFGRETKLPSNNVGQRWFVPLSPRAAVVYGALLCVFCKIIKCFY